MRGAVPSLERVPYWTLPQRSSCGSFRDKLRRTTFYEPPHGIMHRQAGARQLFNRSLTVFLLMSVILSSSRVQQPMRSMAVLDSRPHLHQAASLEYEQERADSLHPEAWDGQAGRTGKCVLTVERRSSWHRRPATLAAFWPHNDAQWRCLVRIVEQHLGRSAVK
jgi:hypothetical protein